MSAATIPTFPDLAGRVAVVTGGSQGIGAELARVLAYNEVRIVVNARRQEPVERLLGELHAEGAQAIGVCGDAGVRADVERVRDAALEAYGRVDLVAAFAGGFSQYTPILELEPDDWRATVDVNLASAFLAIRVLGTALAEGGSGSIVTMASNSARLIDVPLTASYAAAKAGVVQLTRHAAKELGPLGVRVNCVAPATTATERVNCIMPDEVREQVVSLSPLGRLGTPRDSAVAAAYLLSDASGWITGVTLDVAGGRVML